MSIEIFGAARCHKTQFYIAYFEKANLKAKFKDVEENIEYAMELRRLYKNGKLNFPSLVINGKKLRNPKIEKIEKVLNNHKTLEL